MGEVLTGEALHLVLTFNDYISEHSSTGELSKLSLSVTFSGVSIIFIASAGKFLIISMSLSLLLLWVHSQTGICFSLTCSVCVSCDVHFIFFTCCILVSILSVIVPIFVHFVILSFYIIVLCESLLLCDGVFFL